MVKFTNIDKSNFAQGIHKETRRGFKRLLLRQVSAYLEIDTELISKLERGERWPTRDKVSKLVKLCSVTDNELLNH